MTKEFSFNEMLFRRTLSARLQEARHAAGLTQRAAAKAANINQGTLGSYEEDRVMPPIHAVVKLAAVYGVSIMDLLPNSKIKLPKERAEPKDRWFIDELMCDRILRATNIDGLFNDFFAGFRVVVELPAGAREINADEAGDYSARISDHLREHSMTVPFDWLRKYGLETD